MHYHIATLFPEMFTSYFDDSILSRAKENKLIEISIYNIRTYSADRNKKVDDRPFGGGPGMVMSVDPIIKCVEDIKNKIEKRYEKDLKKYFKDLEKYQLKISKLENKKSDIIKPKKIEKPKIKIVVFSPESINFTTAIAKEIVKKYTDIIFIAGRYEGVDSRVVEILKAEQWSIGDYVLTGGELPAMICVDSISRQIEGVLGKFESLEEERVSSHKMYTRPVVYKYKNKNYKVPEVLMSGNHKEIDKWKKEN